jgi:hypothetical protein
MLTPQISTEKLAQSQSKTRGSALPPDSAMMRRRRLYSMIQAEELGDKVIAELLPDAQPHEYEKQLWDYKAELPAVAPGVKLSDSQKKNADVKMAEIVKDAVAFYNSHGGYLVIGVSDSPRKVIGWNKRFDCDELNKKIKGSTNHAVDCHFVTRRVTAGDGSVDIGLLFIPQRPDERPPAQFLKDAPASESGRKAYAQGDILFRDGHECRPARSADDFNFLCSQRRRQIVAPRDEVGFTSVLDNNLGARDPSFIKFIGRENLLSQLWRWLCDRYTPIKLIAGVGGVGKTTLAREFAEDIIRGSPMGFEKVIWLSAKKRFYAPTLNDYVLATRVDFTNKPSLLRALLLQLGHNEADLDPEWSEPQLMDEVISALRMFPCFLIIDDVDSLEAGDQSEVFHAILQLTEHTMGTSKAASRAILTARLSLGASAAQLLGICGLEKAEFTEYVRVTATAMGLPENIIRNGRDIERFHAVTDGSPTFAASILRLIGLGDSLRLALQHWKGTDGDEVREFAFKRELDHLRESQLRTLYVLCLLGVTSQRELRDITQSTNTVLRDDLAELRKYHLIALESELPGSGPTFRVPESIRLMLPLLKDHVHDPRYLETQCGKVRSGSPRLGLDLQHIVSEVVSLWRENKPQDALEQAEFFSKKHSENGELKCLLGRAYLRIEPPMAQKAEKAFRAAHRLGCQRTELVGLWVEAKKLLGDWVGLIEVTRLADKNQPSSDNVYFRAEAFGELADSAYHSGSLSVAAEHYLAGAREISSAFDQGRAVGRVPQLKQLRYNFMHNYVRLLNRVASKPNELLQVWVAAVDAFRFYVRSPSLIRIGLQRLQDWWSTVESRERYDEGSANKLASELKQIDWIMSICRKHDPPDEALLAVCAHTTELMSKRLQRYREMLVRRN